MIWNLWYADPTITRNHAKTIAGSDVDVVDYLKSVFPNEQVEAYTDEIHVYRADDDELSDPIAGATL